MRGMTDDRGTIAILVALLLTTMMAMAAFAIDFGAVLVEQRGLQNGADASSIAVAQDCVQYLVDPVANPTPCTNGQALATATTYFGANSARAVAVDRNLDISLAGKAGEIAVLGEITVAPIFARAAGFAGPFVPSATATARWGPVTAYSAVFPLTVCDGALLAPDAGPVTLQVDPPPISPPPPQDCAGAPFGAAFGWLVPDTLPACTAAVDLLPPTGPTGISVGAADSEPPQAGCGAAIDQLHDDIDAGTPEQRTRMLAVHDRGSGVPSARPAHAVVAFEFTGAKLAGRVSHAAPGVWSGACDLADPAVRCIEGFVRHRLAPLSGPVADAGQATLPGIVDTTVLDVRLAD